MLIDYRNRSLPQSLLHIYYVININRCHIAGGSLYREQRKNSLAVSVCNIHHNSLLLYATVRTKTVISNVAK